SSFGSSDFFFRTQSPLTIGEAIYAMSVTLALNQVSIAPVGEKFLMAFPSSQTKKVGSLLVKFGAPGIAMKKKTLEARALGFRGSSVREIGTIYKNLCGCSVEYDPSLIATRIFFVNQTALTLEEALQGFDLLLGLNGIEVVGYDGGQAVKFMNDK